MKLRKHEQRDVSIAKLGREADTQAQAEEVEKPLPRAPMGNVGGRESSPALEAEPGLQTHSIASSSGGSEPGPRRSTTDPTAYEGRDQNQLRTHGSDTHGASLALGKRPATFRARSHSQQNSMMVLNSEYVKLAATNRRQQARIHQLEEELSEEKSQVQQLQDDVIEQEDIIAKVHSNAINLLSSNVSSNFPDDKIRRELDAFFDGMVRDWCLDLHETEGIDSQEASEVLISHNILVDEPETPAHLKMNMRDETAAPVLLQAALANTLCDLFLTEPFFLQPWMPSISDDVFKDINLEVMTTWRIRTVEFLEAAFPPLTRFFTERAEDFVRKYDCLLQQVEDDALSELVELMEQFAKLAIQLWKRHVLISVEGLERQDLKLFRSAKADMEAEDSVLRGVGGARLDGRPVQVIVRPRIVAQLVHQDGHLAERVVWSKAVVWVSNL